MGKINYFVIVVNIFEVDMQYEFVVIMVIVSGKESVKLLLV